MQVKVTSLCFAGGYESIYEHAWLDAMEDEILYYANEYDLEIKENEFVESDYQGYLVACAVQWLDICTDGKATFYNVRIISPKEYNFENDRVEFDMPLSELSLIRELVKKDDVLLKRFNKICDKRFKEHSGYVPFYKAPNLNSTCRLWNEWQLGALFDTYFYDAFEEYSDDCQDYDDAKEILSNESFWRIDNKELEEL